MGKKHRSAIIAVCHEMHRNSRMGAFAALIGFHHSNVDMMSIHAGAAELWQWSGMNVKSSFRIEAAHHFQPTGESYKFSPSLSYYFSISGGHILSAPWRS